MYAARKNHKDATSILLHAGANVNKCDNEGLTPLIKAATQNATETIPLLIAAGAQINYKQPTTGLTALSFAASFNNTAQIVELLLNANATVDNIDLAQKTPLILACIKNHHDGCKKIIQKLLEHGANIEASDKQGVTPFIAAGWAKNYLALYTLKASGANINHQNILGSTALINAIFESDDTTAQVLINLGVDLNVCNLFGGTALIVAVLKENIYIIQKLLSAYPLNNPKAVAIDYCPRNTTTKKTYNTALIMAIKNKNDVIIKLLLEHGANPTKRNGMGQTPLDIINQSPEELGHLRPLIENAIAEWQPR
jgi:ankyrin repeat protein